MLAAGCSHCFLGSSLLLGGYIAFSGRANGDPGGAAFFRYSPTLIKSSSHRSALAPEISRHYGASPLAGQIASVQIIGRAAPTGSPAQCTRTVRPARSPDSIHTPHQRTPSPQAAADATVRLFLLARRHRDRPGGQTGQTSSPSLSLGMCNHATGDTEGANGQGAIHVSMHARHTKWERSGERARERRKKSRG